MNITGDAKAISTAFVKACGEMSAIVIEDSKGNFGMYTSLAAIVKVTAAPLAKYGLKIIQEGYIGVDGVTVDTWLLHESGSTIQFASLTLPLAQRTPQAVGSALTYARRYQWASVCGLAPSDDDGQAAEDAQKPRQGQAVRPPSAQRAQAGTSTPKRTVEPSTGEIVEPPQDVDFGMGKNNNPFNDTTPYYVAAWRQLTGKHYDFVKWIHQLHLKGEPCSKAQYGLVTGIVDALTNNEHNYALSVLCQAEISKTNVPSLMAAKAILARLQKEIPAVGEDGKAIKDDEGKIVKVANPEYRADMAAIVTDIAAQMEVEQPALEVATP